MLRATTPGYIRAARCACASQARTRWRADPALPSLAIAVARDGRARRGCGLGAGKGTSDVSLTVTRGFGSEQVASITRIEGPRLRDRDADARALVPGVDALWRRLRRVDRRAVRRLLAGATGSTTSTAIEARLGAASTAVHRGDRIWWDLHDWTATDSIPAVVGSFPEPFIHGVGGRRLPTTLECAPDAPGGVQAGRRRS